MSKSIAFLLSFLAFTATAQAKVGFNITPLELGLYGPHLSFEYGDRFAVAMKGRYGDIGLLSHLGYDGDEEYQYSYGVGIGFRTYFTGDLEGGFVGSGFEFAHTHWEEIQHDGFGNPYGMSQLIGYVEGGYRWIFGQFLLTLGGAFGGSIPIEKPDNSSDEAGWGVMFIPTVELGFVF